jgi:hypothetical protein
VILVFLAIKTPRLARGLFFRTWKKDELRTEKSEVLRYVAAGPRLAINSYKQLQIVNEPGVRGAKSLIIYRHSKSLWLTTLIFQSNAGVP